MKMKDYHILYQNIKMLNLFYFFKISFRMMLKFYNKAFYLCLKLQKKLKNNYIYY